MGRGKKTDSQQKASFKKSLWVLRYEQETLSRASFADACTEDRSTAQLCWTPCRGPCRSADSSST